jgi:DNA replication and repair protein RecF
MAGRLVAVSFKSQDLYLLRGGPKYRREWIDTILATIRPSNQETFNKYEKVVTQRNRLLKTIFESGRLSVSDQDELKVWDVQLAKYGANIVRQRLELLAELQPKAQKFQEHLSGQKENLTAQYELSQEDDSGDTQAQQLSLPLGAAQKNNDDQAIAESILRALRDRRGEEIARKQTVVGPHRDDIGFAINGRGAVDFASQGQQRSLVLSLKLAELERVSDMLTEPPLLLLDDVLAELDLLRQGLLMSLLSDEMQTVITTTHVDGFKPEWLAGALFHDVTGGTIQARHESCAV